MWFVFIWRTARIGRRLKTRMSRGDPPGKVNPCLFSGEVNPNGEEWGLPDEDFPVVRADVRHDVQSASCVPPRDLAALDHELTSEFAFGDASRKAHIERAVEHMFGHCYHHYVYVPTEPERVCTGALLAYIGSAHPLSLFWYGEPLAALLFTITRESRSLETYLLSPWVQGSTEHQSCNPALLSQVLEHSGYEGFARVLMGDPVNAFRKVEEDLGRSVEVEFGFVNLTNREESSSEVIDEMLLRIAPGGAVFVFGPQSESAFACYNQIPFQRLTERIARQFYDLEVVKKPYRQHPLLNDILKVVEIDRGQVTVIVREPTRSATSVPAAAG